MLHIEQNFFPHIFKISNYPQQAHLASVAVKFQVVSQRK